MNKIIEKLKSLGIEAREIAEKTLAINRNGCHNAVIFNGLGEFKTILKLEKINPKG